MTKYSELAARYANALFDLASEANIRDKVFSEIRLLDKIYSSNEEVGAFVTSPLVKASDKVEFTKKVFIDKGFSEVVEKFLITLAHKNRLQLFSEIVFAYQAKSDETNQVSRGEVTSASVLTPEERAEVEETVKKVTGRKVILNYEEDPELIGGLIAKVGSYTFDDSLTSHLRRLQEDIKRRAH